MTTPCTKRYLDHTAKALAADVSEIDDSTRKFIDLLQDSVDQDFIGREEDSTEADMAEAKLFTDLASKFSEDAEDREVLTHTQVLSSIANVRESFKQALSESSKLLKKQHQSDIKTICGTPFIFEYAYDQFATAKISSGFKFISLLDDPNRLDSWVRPIPEIISCFAHSIPSLISRLTAGFILFKIGHAECQMTILGDALYKIFSAQDFWDAVYHKDAAVTYKTASKLLLVYGIDATLWLNSPYTVLDQVSSRRAIQKQDIKNLKTMRETVAILLTTSSMDRKEVDADPYIDDDIKEVLLSKDTKYPKNGLTYIRKLLSENPDILVPPELADLITMDEVPPVYKKRAAYSFSPEFVKLTRFLISPDYVKLENLVRESDSSKISPIDIDTHVLAWALSAIIPPRSGDKLFEQLIKDFEPIGPLVFATGYTLTWLAYLVRFNTIWSLRYADRVVEAVKELAPEFNEYSSNPILLLKKASEKWLEDEQHIRAEQERETAERAAKMKEAAAKLERERLEAIEKMESERKGKLKAEGFQLASDSGGYEKWFKDNTCRIFFKTTSPEEKKGVLIGLEELGISASKVRNIKNPAGIIRTITIGEDEIYSDSLIENALHKAARFKPEGPVFNTEVVSTAFDLVFDKTFFELEWLDKAIVRAMDDKVSIQDARYCTKVMRDRGIIGQIKGKKNGPKIFALTPEGYSLYQIQKDYPNLPILAVPWEKYIGEEVAERLGTLPYFDITTRPVKDIDKMIAGKTPRFLDKYYVTAI